MSKDFVSGAYLGASAALIAVLYFWGLPHQDMVVSNLETIYKTHSIWGLEKPSVFWSLMAVSCGAVLTLFGSLTIDSKSE